jgi:manganese/iron transport system ATP-binding protein
MSLAVHTKPHVPAPHDRSAPALELDNVSVYYGNVCALDRVSLALQPGDQCAIVGPNGAGKSTLFHVVAGVVRPDAGAVRIYGSTPGGHICVGYVPQRTKVDAHFPVTVRDVVMMGRTGKIGMLRRPGRSDRTAVNDALERVSMADLARRQIGELSGGQQQRVYLARALAQEAEILLLDEPLTGLDLPSQEAILALLDDLRRQGITVLVATHDLNQARGRFPLVALVNRRLVAFGAPDRVLTAANLAFAFGSHIHVVHTSQGDLLVTDSCCDGDHPLPEPMVGRDLDEAVALPEYEVRVDGVRADGERIHTR